MTTDRIPNSHIYSDWNLSFHRSIHSWHQVFEKMTRTILLIHFENLLCSYNWVKSTHENEALETSHTKIDWYVVLGIEKYFSVCWQAFKVLKAIFVQTCTKYEPDQYDTTPWVMQLFIWGFFVTAERQKVANSKHSDEKQSQAEKSNAKTTKASTEFRAHSFIGAKLKFGWNESGKNPLTRNPTISPVAVCNEHIKTASSEHLFQSLNWSTFI